MTPSAPLAGSTGFDDSLELHPGCPVDLELRAGEHRFLKLNRTSLDSQFQIEWGFEDKTGLMLFGWHQQPFLDGQNNVFDDYKLPLDQVGNQAYPAEANMRDIYHIGERGLGHCGSADTDGDPTDCVGPNPEEHSGFLFITVVGFNIAQDEVQRSRVAFNFVEPSSTIQPEQLEAIRDLHTQTCAPSQALLPVFNASTNARWERHSHAEGVYSTEEATDFMQHALFNTSGFERDADSIPFCEWLYGVDVASVSDCTVLGDHGVSCDATGNIVGLSLDHKALSGMLPRSFSALTHLVNLDLSFNQLTGALPAHLLSSGKLEILDVRQNAFSGEIPCPAAGTSPALKRIALSDNDFSGDLPACLFEDLPALERARFDDLVGLTPGPLPSTVKHATGLIVLSARNARRTGSVPLELGCLPLLTTLHLAMNALSGPLDQTMVDGMPRMVDFDVSFNDLSGPIPTFGASHDSINLLRLNNNRFSGELAVQLEAFGSHQDRRLNSILNLANNRFTGELPRTFRSLATDAHPVQELNADGNHFRCEGVSDHWPRWVSRLHRIEAADVPFGTFEFGKCARLPVVHSAVNPKVGQLMTVFGEFFEPSDELRCKLGDHAFQALWVSSTEIACRIPDEIAPGQTLALTAANYGDDFDEPASRGVAMVEVTIPHSPPSPPPPSPPSAPPSPPALPELGQRAESRRIGMIAGGAAGGVVFLMLGCLAFIVLRERQGKPIFATVHEVKQLGVVDVQAKIAATSATPDSAATSTRTSVSTSVASAPEVADKV